MADLVSVPDSGAGSGSSTATFGENLGQIFAMPSSGQVETSAAETDSGVDARDPGSYGRVRGRVLRLGNEPRSLTRASPRHGASSTPSSRSPSTRRTPTQSSTGGARGGPAGSKARSPSGSAKFGFEPVELRKSSF